MIKKRRQENQDLPSAKSKSLTAKASSNKNTTIPSKTNINAGHVSELFEAGEYKATVDLLKSYEISENNRPNSNNIRFYDILIECFFHIKEFKKAIDCSNSVLKIDPKNLMILAKKASSQRMSGATSQAIRTLEEALAISPNNPALLYNLGNALQDNKEIERALNTYQASITAGNSSSDCYRNYGRLLLEERRYNEALAIASEGYEKNMQDIKILILFTDCLCIQQSYDKAYSIICARSKPNNDKDAALLYAMRSQCLDGLGDKKESINLAEEADLLDPNNTHIKFQLASLYTYNGHLDKSKDILEQIIKKDLLNFEAHRRLSHLTRYSSEHYHYKQLRALYNKQVNQLGDDHLKLLHFALAKAAEDSKEFTEASFHLAEGNRLVNIDAAKHFNFSDWMQTAFKHLEIDRIFCAKPEMIKDKTRGNNMVFIVGMPRSGSTLTENILSMKENALDLGETNAFQIAVDHLEEKKILSAEMLDKLYELYFSRLNIKPTDYSLITDKSLYNWRFAGLIMHCFPGAKIIHSYRNPLDNMLSIFKAFFPLGNEYAFDLESIFKVYQLQAQCMNHYKKRHPNQFINSCYEELVSNPQASIKKLINYLGIEWSDDFLRPEQSNRKVSTTSSVEVRQPIHSKSIKKWEQFSQLLQPYADEFKRLGYEID